MKICSVASKNVNDFLEVDIQENYVEIDRPQEL